MFVKTIQGGRKMACGSDLTPVREEGVGKESIDSLRNHGGPDTDLADLLGHSGAKIPSWRSARLDRHSRTTTAVLHHRHCPGQVRSWLRSSRYCSWRPSLFAAAQSILSQMKIWAVHPNTCHSLSLHLMDLLLHMFLGSFSKNPVGPSLWGKTGPHHCSWSQDYQCFTSSLSFIIPSECPLCSVDPGSMTQTLVSWGIGDNHRILTLGSWHLSTHLAALCHHLDCHPHRQQKLTSVAIPTSCHD